MRLRVRSLPLLSGLTIRRCRELWCRLQTRLGSRVAVALAEAGGYSSDSTPSLGTSICHGSGPRNSKKKKKKGKGSKYRHSSDLALPWLWCRLAATAPIQPLAWEPPYATGAAQEIATTTTTKQQQKRQKTKKKKSIRFSPWPQNFHMARVQL